MAKKRYIRARRGTCEGCGQPLMEKQKRFCCTDCRNDVARRERNRK